VYVRAATGGAEERGYYIGVGSANNGNGGSLTYNATTNFLSLKSPYNSGTIALSLEGNTNSVQFHNTSGTVVSKFVSSTGNLLIGTTTDAGFKLDVNGTVRSNAQITGLTFNATNLANSYYINGVNVLDYGSGVRIGYSASVTKVGIYTSSGSERISVINNGNVGFGTTTPVANIHTAGSITAASALAQGVFFNNTLVAAANNDVLVGLDINPTFTNGAFTGVSNLALRVTGGYSRFTGSEAIGKVIEIASNAGKPFISFVTASNIGLVGSAVAVTGGATADFGLGTHGSTGNLVFGTGVGYSERLRIVGSTGNVLIGTTTDAGFKLDVSGTGRFSSYLYVGGGSGSGLATSSTNTSLVIWNRTVTASGDGILLGNGFNALGGTNINLNVVRVPVGTTYGGGTNTTNVIYITPTINNSGGTNILRGIYYEPTLTSLTGTTHRAIETVTGNVIFGSTSGNVLIGTTTDAGYKLDVNGTARVQGAFTATLANVSTANVVYYNTTTGLFTYGAAPGGGGGGTVTSVGLSSATSGVTIGATPVTTSGTITIAIATASGSQNGLLSSTNWTTFNNKQNAISLTTTGTSGAATFVSNTLNIPNYTLAGLGYSVPTLAQVTTAGNTTTNAITVGGLTVDTNTLVVDATNNRVGIGIASPTDKLHIVDSSNANIFGRITATGTNASAAWVAQNDQVDNVVYRVFGSGVSGTQMGIALARSASLLANLGGSGKFLLGTFSNTDFVMGTGNAEKMRIVDSTGNVLIGTTSDNGNKLQVNGTIDGQAFAVNGVNGWTGTIMIIMNPPGMQNIQVDNGIITNVF
jgi:hypothetical protein